MTQLKRIYNTYRADETQTLAKHLALKINQTCTILLEGEIGSGKTTFTQGLALGLGIEKTLSSPTFTIMKQYQGRFALNHIDAYRLESHQEDLGLEDVMDTHSVTVIEWPQFVPELWPKTYLHIKIEVGRDSHRVLHIHALGTYEESLIKNL